MLLHMLEAAGCQLEQAKDAVDAAKRAWEANMTKQTVNDLNKAAVWLQQQQLNGDKIQFKRTSLGVKGVYVLGEDHCVIHLTEEEKKWNGDMCRFEQAEARRTAA